MRKSKIYEAKYKMDRDANVFWAKRNIIDYIWKSANLEGIAVTFPETEAIYNGVSVDGCSVEDIVKINNMKHAWQFMLDTLDYPIDYGYICKLHQIIGANSIYNAGYIRSVPVSMGGTKWKPELPIESVVKEELNEILNETNAMERALDLSLYCMRKQMFIDGNKRVAMIAANQVMISNGMGVLSVAQQDIEEFGGKLIYFYETGKKDEIKDFMYERCVDGENMTTDLSASHEKKINYSEEYYQKKSKEYARKNHNLEFQKEDGLEL